jgi:hypothetical protein
MLNFNQDDLSSRRLECAELEWFGDDRRRMVIFMILWPPAGQHLHCAIQRIRGRMEFSSGVGSKSRFFTVARVFGFGPEIEPV